MTNFSDIVKQVQDTTNNLVGFMETFSTIINYINDIYRKYNNKYYIRTNNIIPNKFCWKYNSNTNYSTSFIVYKFDYNIKNLRASTSGQVSKVSKIRNSMVLGIVLTIFVGVVSLEGTLSSSIDGITAKTGKAVVSSAIPVVGKILGDAVDTVLGCGLILKNAVGIIE